MSTEDNGGLRAGEAPSDEAWLVLYKGKPWQLCASEDVAEAHALSPGLQAGGAKAEDFSVARYVAAPRSEAVPSRDVKELAILRRLAKGVRAFRNTPMLEKLTKLRATKQYSQMGHAFLDWCDLHTTEELLAETPLEDPAPRTAEASVCRCAGARTANGTCRSCKLPKPSRSVVDGIARSAGLTSATPRRERGLLPPLNQETLDVAMAGARERIVLGGGDPDALLRKAGENIEASHNACPECGGAIGCVDCRRPTKAGLSSCLACEKASAELQALRAVRGAAQSAVDAYADLPRDQRPGWWFSVTKALALPFTRSAPEVK